MAVLDLQDQEEIENAKRIWHSWGKWIFGLLLIAAIAFLGYVAWKQHIQSENAMASERLAEFNLQIQNKNEQQAIAQLHILQDKYPHTVPTAEATLMMAGRYFYEGKYQDAQKNLTWLQKNQSDPMIQAITILRLATLQLQQKQYTDALKTLEAPVNPAYQGEILNLKGDILAAQGKIQEAHQAYKAALKALPQESNLRTYIEVKSYL